MTTEAFSASIKIGVLPNNSLFLGAGIFCWDRIERISDRYGTCRLHIPSSEENVKLKFIPQEEKGCLLAEVVEAYESTHIGDIMRRIFPIKPNKGEIFILGEGKFFDEVYVPGKPAIGTIPEDGRKHDWLNPYCLYNIHDCLVNLYWQKL